MKELTPEVIENIKRALEDHKKDDRDRSTLRGKYAPETGICAVCTGKIVGDVRQHLSDRIGGPPPTSYVHGWYCEDCGVTYHHLPKKIDKTKGEK